MSQELSERIRRNTTPNLDGWIRRLMTEAATEIERLDRMVRYASDQGLTFPSETLPKVMAAVVVVDPDDGSERLAYDPDAETSSKH